MFLGLQVETQRKTDFFGFERVENIWDNGRTTTQQKHVTLLDILMQKCYVLCL